MKSNVRIDRFDLLDGGVVGHHLDDRVPLDERTGDRSLRTAVDQPDRGAVAVGVVRDRLLDRDLRPDVGVIAHRFAVGEFGLRVPDRRVRAGGDSAFHRAALPDPRHEIAGVELVDGRHALAFEPLGDVLGQLPGDDASWVDSIGLESLLSDPVVTRSGEYEKVSICSS